MFSSVRALVFYKGQQTMKPRSALTAGLMVLYASLPAQAQQRGFGRYANSPVHTAFGVYPYSYSNPAFRAGGGTVAGTDAFFMRQMHSQQLQAMFQQQNVAVAQQKAMRAAAEKANKASAKTGDKNTSAANIASVPVQQPAPHVKGRQEQARERARKREAAGTGQK